MESRGARCRRGGVLLVLLASPGKPLSFFSPRPRPSTAASGAPVPRPASLPSGEALPPRFSLAFLSPLRRRGRRPPPLPRTTGKHFSCDGRGRKTEVSNRTYEVPAAATVLRKESCSHHAPHGDGPQGPRRKSSCWRREMYRSGRRDTFRNTDPSRMSELLVTSCLSNLCARHSHLSHSSIRVPTRVASLRRRSTCSWARSAMGPGRWSLPRGR